MRLQLHAKRYADNWAERDQTFNSTPADLDLGDRELVIRAKGHTVTLQLGDDTPIVLTLAEYEHTAIALVYEEEAP